MIITPHFVYIHYPKTGGSFVTAMVTGLYPPMGVLPEVVERMTKRTVRGTWPQRSATAAKVYLRTLGHLDLNKHGGCAQIPECFTDRPLVTTVRNPYDRYVSMYEFPLWRTESEPYLQRSRLAELLPHFPDVTFHEFVTEVSEHRGPWCAPSPVADRLGFETRDLIFHFCRRPGQTVERVMNASPADMTEIVRADLCDLTFLRTEHLNDDLADYLHGFGHSDDVLDPIRASQKVWPREGGRDAQATWRPYYSEELLARVRRKERVLLELFPEYDVEGATGPG